MIRDNIFQLAYLTNDIDRAMAQFRSKAPIRTEFYFEVDIDIVRPSGPGRLQNKMAFMWVGDFQYELIQPIAGLEDIFGAYVPKDEALTFHHTCARIEDWIEFRKAVDDQPYPIAFEGGNDQARFLYLDARKDLGHFLEYSYSSDEIWKAGGGR